MDNPIFKDPEAVERQMKLPSVVAYSFVGISAPSYHAKLEEIVVRIAGESNIRKRGFRESKGGKYTAYHFEIFHSEFAEVMEIYREVCGLDGTRFVI